MRRQLVFFLSFMTLMLFAVDGSSRDATRPPKTARCLTTDQVAEAVNSLSREYGEAQGAQRLLRQSSRRTSACRQQIVAAVMSAMDKPGLDIRQNQADANLWRQGAILLGDLKATESLDLLLSHLRMRDGQWSSTMKQQPALAGIIRMGPLAIPKLQKLLRNQDWPTRHDAVYCIASIGGPSARRVIERAVSMESHPCVKRLMLVSIQTIDVKYGGLKQDHGQFADAFMCTS